MKINAAADAAACLGVPHPARTIKGARNIPPPMPMLPENAILLTDHHAPRHYELEKAKGPSAAPQLEVRRP